MRIWLWALAAALAIGTPAQAETYPDHPVKIFNDSAPGSATDVAARVMAERLSQIWNQQVVVENRPGAGGSLAVRAAMSSPNDGYTLYFGAASTITALKGAPGVAPNLPIELPMFIAVSPKIGVSSLPELIALAKQKPGELSYATTGRGRITHLTMELIQERAGIKLQMIPYTGGPTAAMSDVGTGRVAIVIEGYSGLAGGMSSGLIKGIAVASLERLPDFKDLPTVAETLPSFVAGGWNVLLAPVGTPDAIINKASVDLRKVVEDPEVKSKFGTIGGYVHPMTPAEVTAFAQDQQKTWRPIAEKIAAEMQK
jgi:tripartite-type tricarboxylate transporter receptor subunit TctC